MTRKTTPEKEDNPVFKKEDNTKTLKTIPKRLVLKPPPPQDKPADKPSRKRKIPENQRKINSLFKPTVNKRNNNVTSKPNIDVYRDASIKQSEGQSDCSVVTCQKPHQKPDNTELDNNIFNHQDIVSHPDLGESLEKFSLVHL